MALGTAAAIGGGLGLASLGSGLFGASQQSKAAKQANDQSQWERAKGYERAMDAYNRWARPELTGAMQNRIKALQEESQMTPLAVDPLFQGERARLVSGGAKELAGVGNRQAATGASGGFGNVGNVQDLYDRLSVGLSELAGRQRATKEQQAQQAADIVQNYDDMSRQSQNQWIQNMANAALGQSSNAVQDIGNAYNRSSAANQSLSSAIQGPLNLGASLAALSMQQRPQTTAPLGYQQDFTIPSSDSFGSGSYNLPYRLMR